MTTIAVDAADLNSVLANAEKFNEQFKQACAIVDRQNRMLDLALAELTALLHTEAIPAFFRQQIVGTLVRIKECA